MVKAISYTRLTLALDIIGKLTEGPFSGYHELGIIKQQISLGDTITIKESEKMLMSCNHDGVPDDSRNICWQAAELLQKECGISQNVSIDIDKVIPVQGGLAGGSTNAATVIELLDEIWGLSLSLSDKMTLGRKLGMDVPFYFNGNCAFDSEATGVLEAVSHSMKLYFVLVVPPFGVSTADAYRGIQYDKVGTRTDQTTSLRQALLEGDHKKMVENIHNDFEISVFPQFCKLEEIKAKLLQSGAGNAFMSGSGSTMVGVFDDLSKASDSATIFSNAFVCETI
jgi:4-diphosphocytidyl-2-C-methyl-D-erythritol kinase